MLKCLEEERVFNLSIILLSLSAVLVLSFSQVSASTYGFEDGIGSGWNYGGRTHWHVDDKQSFSGDASLRSGAIKCTGESSIYRYVEGPADISFWWMKHPSTGPYGKGTVFTFSVNGVVQRVCEFSDWRKEIYTIPDNGTYEIRWDFRKITCYPQSEGSGWIDDVEVAPEKPLGKLPLREDCTCQPRLEGQLSPKVDSLNWRGGWEISTTYYKHDVVSHDGSSYICLENNSDITPSNTKFWDLLASKGDPGMCSQVASQEEELISYIQIIQDTINASKEIRKDNVVRVGIGDDLQDKINGNPINTTFYLENGYRYVGTIIINESMNNITIMSDGRATLDADGENFVVGLDNTQNISICNINIMGGLNCGIIVESSRYCEINENNVKFHEHSGIYVNSSKYIVANENTITSIQDSICDGDNYGINLRNTSYSIIKNNIIDVKGYYVRLNRSYDNVIATVLTNSFVVYDNGMEYNLYKSSLDDICRYEHILNNNIRYIKDIEDSYNVWRCS